jgi:hypothetical protein
VAYPKSGKALAPFDISLTAIHATRLGVTDRVTEFVGHGRFAGTGWAGNGYDEPCPARPAFEHRFDNIADIRSHAAIGSGTLAPVMKATASDMV